jgi:AraC-like DNA-binding protein
MQAAPHATPTYAEWAPGAALAPYVQCYWTLEAEAAGELTTRVLPDGCVDVLVDLGTRGGTPGSARVVGAMTTASVVPLTGRVSVLGVRFRPGGAAPFLCLPLDEVTDGDAPLEALWGREGAALAPRLAEAPRLRDRVSRLEQVLLSRLPSARTPDPAVAHAVSSILGVGGALPVRMLEEATGLSGRTLERRFHAAVGLTPKVLCRVARLQGVVQRAERAGLQQPDWAGLALEGGYCDQAHLVREFRALVGLTPGAWARERVGFVQDGGTGHP